MELIYSVPKYIQSQNICNTFINSSIYIHIYLSIPLCDWMPIAPVLQSLQDCKTGALSNFYGVVKQPCVFIGCEVYFYLISHWSAINYKYYNEKYVNHRGCQFQIFYR